MNSNKREDSSDKIGFENKFPTSEEYGDMKKLSAYGAVIHNVNVLNEIKNHINTKGSSAL